MNEMKVNQVSPYNLAHGNYGDCCGIFNAFDKTGIVICNECNMTVQEHIENEITFELEAKNKVLERENSILRDYKNSFLKLVQSREK